MKIEFMPIGVVRVDRTDSEVREMERHLVEGELQIHPQFAEALDGIDGFSHLFVLCYFHKLRPEQIGPLKVKPRALLRKGFSLDQLPLLGVFALDSPTRPNPIGLTLVEALKRQGCRITVRGLDFFDGTPILDIKGYRVDYRTETYHVPEWYKQIIDERGHS
jgi:tRNA-Thr(GGU) m(6)t(6)A37 methyltransferase TsaA